MSDKKTKNKNYRLRGKIYKAAGYTTIGLGTAGGFLGYQAINDFQAFQDSINDFVVVQEESLKLNMTIALPIVVGLIIFFLIMRKKNKEFFGDKIVVDLFIWTMFAYGVYSVIEMVLFALLGALGGSVFEEFLFTPLANKNIKIANKKERVDNEVEIERAKTVARRKVEEEVNSYV